jgi:LPXTG-motif cell wall-anchored protein
MRRTLLLLVPLAALAPVVFGGPDAHAADDFVLSASLSGLYPNVDADFPVSVTNPRDFAIAVQSATVTIGDASPSCTSTYLAARSFSGDVVVPAHGSATFPVHLHMAGSAPDACQGATFPLTFTATGSPVGTTRAADRVTGSGHGFAFTGADSITLGAIGLGAVGIGLVLLRRRRAGEVPR